MKKVYIQKSEISDYIKNSLQGKGVEFTDENDADIIVYDDFKGKISDNCINIHPSLLPAFEGENAIERAFSAGVKVSGVTILKGDKIIAQYPVLIGIETHMDEFIQDIIDVEKRLVPPVVEAVVNDRVFDFQDLFRNPCSHKGGCGGCNHCS
ncbi:hypothetical protein IJ579_02875 [bacterium]|nr:hypothetical protein [bacterium]